jgi:fibronectin type III domain protein
VILLAIASTAEARERMRVRWLPVTGATVNGYFVHVRMASEPLYGAPHDVGLPGPNPDGSLEAVIGGLDPVGSYVVSVSAYDAGGPRTERSNELALLPRLGLCAFREEGDACDPCVAGGSCAGGACLVEQGTSPLPGSALTAHLVAHRRRLRGEGTFVAPGNVDPSIDGATVELVGADGAVVHRAELPADGFRVREQGQLFRWTAARGAPGGVRRLVLRREGDVLEVRLRARARVSLASAVEPLTWIVHVGSRCVRQVDLRCEAGRRRVRCN